MNIYDEKRRNAVQAYCAAQKLTPTERCIQLEDALTAAPLPSEVLFQFGGWLTCRSELTILGSTHSATPICDRIAEFVDHNDLEGPREGWHDMGLLSNPEEGDDEPA